MRTSFATIPALAVLASSAKGLSFERDDHELYRAMRRLRRGDTVVQIIPVGRSPHQESGQSESTLVSALSHVAFELQVDHASTTIAVNDHEVDLLKLAESLHDPSQPDAIFVPAEGILLHPWRQSAPSPVVTFDAAQSLRYRVPKTALTLQFTSKLVDTQPTWHSYFGEQAVSTYVPATRKTFEVSVKINSLVSSPSTALATASVPVLRITWQCDDDEPTKPSGKPEISVLSDAALVWTVMRTIEADLDITLTEYFLNDGVDPIEIYSVHDLPSSDLAEHDVNDVPSLWRTALSRLEAASMKPLHTLIKIWRQSPTGIICWFGISFIWLLVEIALMLWSRHRTGSARLGRIRLEDDGDDDTIEVVVEKDLVDLKTMLEEDLLIE